MFKSFKKLIFQWFHRGGKVERDELGRINWQCSKCGRWTDHPVEIKYENALLDEIIEMRKKENAEIE